MSEVGLAVLELSALPGHPAADLGHQVRLEDPVACHHLACTLGVELCFCDP